MGTAVQIIDILAWPLTILAVVLALRSPLSELVPTLRKLKYKDLELEFEKEAIEILAETESELPEIPKQEKVEHEDKGVRFSRRRIEPLDEILNSWTSLELKLREMSGEEISSRGIGHMVRNLTKAGLIPVEMSRLILRLSTLRNRVAHTDQEAINYNVSSPFKEAVDRILTVLEILKR